LAGLKREALPTKDAPAIGQYSGSFSRELLYSTLIGANSAPHTPMVTELGPLDCFCAFFFSETFTLWLVVGLAHFAFVRFFAFSSLLFVFSLFLFHISYFDCF
jgi:hypothetical protein